MRPAHLPRHYSQAYPHAGLAEAAATFQAPLDDAPSDMPGIDLPSGEAEVGAPLDDLVAKPLGAARAQLHENYIIAQRQCAYVYGK